MTRRRCRWVPVAPASYEWERVRGDYAYAFVNNRLRIVVYVDFGFWLLAAPLARYAQTVTYMQRCDVYTATDYVPGRGRNAWP